jgi:hypothetical protein
MTDKDYIIRLLKSPKTQHDCPKDVSMLPLHYIAVEVRDSYLNLFRMYGNNGKYFPHLSTYATNILIHKISRACSKMNSVRQKTWNWKQLN